MTKCKQCVALLTRSVYIGFAPNQNYTKGFEKKPKHSSKLDTCNLNVLFLSCYRFTDRSVKKDLCVTNKPRKQNN